MSKPSGQRRRHIFSEYVLTARQTIAALVRPVGDWEWISTTKGQTGQRFRPKKPCRQPTGRASATHPRSRRWSKRTRSEEHTSELQTLMRISYAVFCLK